MVERIKTFVKGLDDQLQGGIPKGHVILLVGQPGTMKSSLAFSMLYNNAKRTGLSGVQVSLEQSRDSLVDNMKGLGMKLDSEIAKRISILDLGFIRKKLTQFGNHTWMEIFKMYTRNLKSNMDYDLLVIDSLPVIEVMARFRNPREDLFHLFEWFRDLDTTTVLIHEMPQDNNRFAQHGEDFLSDGIIHLDMKREHNVVKLYLAVTKMRKTNHDRGYFPLLFDKDGFEIVTD
jgi:KaiC/GvpD/RAD55 family RecA-like ATPase